MQVVDVEFFKTTVLWLFNDGLIVCEYLKADKPSEVTEQDLLAYNAVAAKITPYFLYTYSDGSTAEIPVLPSFLGRPWEYTLHKHRMAPH